LSNRAIAPELPRGRDIQDGLARPLVGIGIRCAQPLETAKINLEFTRLVSPIEGVAGQAQLQVGALVSPGSGVVTSVSTLDPIKAYFTVSEPQYLEWRKRLVSCSPQKMGMA
jgi:hypothetical protein